MPRDRTSMSNRKLFLIALTCGAVVAVTIPFVGRAANVKSTLNPNSAVLESKSNKVTEIVSTEDEPQVISVLVTPDGFEPSETMVRHGKCLILLQNRTGRRDLNFSLTREKEGRVAESDSQKRDWKAHVQLSPGTYILGETNHPEWKSVIQVTN